MNASAEREMPRITFRIPREQREVLDERVEAGEFPSRSEALREAVREFVDDHAEVSGEWSE